MLGYRAHGFFNLDVDEPDLYHQLGILIDHYELQEVFDIEVLDKEVSPRKDFIKKTFDISGITETQMDKLAKLVVKFDKFMKKYNLNVVVVRCWPEFAAGYGIAPCAAMSILQAEGKILGCEGDLLGSLSMLGHQAIGAETPFLADFSQVNLKENFVLLWHCGVAPCNLWDGKCVRSLDTYFAGGKGVTVDFVLKSGKISLFRLDYAPGEYRTLLIRANGVPMTKDLKGTYVKVVFDENVKSILDKIIQNGIAHHISVVYGDFIHPFEILAKLKGWKVIE
jgi:L-fucose isomerase-like protein